MTMRGTRTTDASGDGERAEATSAPVRCEPGTKERRDAALELMRSTCQLGSTRRPAQLDLRGMDLAGQDLSGLDLSRYDLTGTDLRGANLTGSSLAWAQLGEAELAGARLDDCELLGADLAGADLSECQATRASFGTANLVGASLIGAQLSDATFTSAKLCQADLRASRLQRASLRNADLSGANLIRADLTGADLKCSRVDGANFELASLAEARLLGLECFTTARWVGADIRNCDGRGALMVRRFVLDENYLYEFRTRSRTNAVLYWAWWITSDCGRSLFRWAAFVIAIALAFAALYSLVEIDYGSHPTAFSPFYFSVVTMTTLGYGDVVPASIAAQLLAVTESLIGYVGLGGLLSILSNKMARRAD